MSAAQCSGYSQLLLDNPKMRIGRFCCAATRSDFTTAGDISLPTLVFPITSTFIEKNTKKPFLSDATRVNIYDGAQPYQRKVLDPRGDHCHWFEFAPDDFYQALQLSNFREFQVSENALNLDQIAIQPGLYLAQLKLFSTLRSGLLSEAAAYEQGLLLLDSVLTMQAHNQIARLSAKKRKTWQELTYGAQQIIAKSPEDNISVARIAKLLNSSAFHLCRVFKAVCGVSLHQYRLMLRLSLGLVQLMDSQSITDIAMNMGFASLAHFSTAMQKVVGCNPREIRRQLQS